MHGTILMELQHFVESRLGAEAWPRLLGKAGLGGHQYEPFGDYPDGEALALVAAGTQLTGLSQEQLLFDFGAFLAPQLLELYWAVVEPSWRTLEVLEHTESSIHRVVRLNAPSAQPPKLVCRRTSENEVVIRYGSARRMCALARGLAQGVASYYGEAINLSERACMHRGDAECEISVIKVL